MVFYRELRSTYLLCGPWCADSTPGRPEAGTSFALRNRGFCVKVEAWRERWEDAGGCRRSKEAADGRRSCGRSKEAADDCRSKGRIPAPLRQENGQAGDDLGRPDPGERTGRSRRAGRKKEHTGFRCGSWWSLSCGAATSTTGGRPGRRRTRCRRGAASTGRSSGAWGRTTGRR